MAEKFTLKTLVQETCTLNRIQNGDATYSTSSGFVFVVPVADMGDASFFVEEKGMTLMRWIRKALDATK